MSRQVVLTRHGYYELASKPTSEELSRYYSEKYYQQSVRVHQHVYESEEIRFRHVKLEQKLLKVSQIRGTKSPGSFLDVGAGEGFALKHFADAGWSVTGLDYSSFGCKTHHPELLDRLVTGDVGRGMKRFVEEGRKFDVVLMDNVLEHVLDPLAALQVAGDLLSAGGVLIVEVPNDFSRLQMRLLESGRITDPFWVVVPDHISYFNREGLVALADEAGLETRAVLADFPIDFFLANEHTNYVADKSKGKSCHKARVALDTLMHEASAEGALAFYEALGALGMGRQIMAYFQTKPSVEAIAAV